MDSSGTLDLYHIINFLLQWCYACTRITLQCPPPPTPHKTWTMNLMLKSSLRRLNDSSDGERVHNTTGPFIRRGTNVCAVPQMDVKMGVPSASISWWTLKIPRCPSWRWGELLPAATTIYKFPHWPTGGTAPHCQQMIPLANPVLHTDEEAESIFRTGIQTELG